MDVIHGDCLEVLPMLEPGSVDLVFSSPPYEDSRSYGIDFSLKGEEWVRWMVCVFRESLRVSRGLVAMVVQGKTRRFRWSATPALLMADLHREGIHLRNPPVFHRVGIPGSGGPDWLKSDYEWIVCAAQPGRLPWSDNTAMGHPPKWAPGGAMSYRNSDGERRNRKTGERVRGRRSSGLPVGAKQHTKARANGEMEWQTYLPPERANPGNVVHCKVGGGRMGSMLCHENEAPFPESLAEFFIRSFCRPGGTVLDPFCGSGTTLAVAEKWGRKAIGIDIRESQVALTHRRLETSRSDSGEKHAEYTQSGDGADQAGAAPEC